MKHFLISEVADPNTNPFDRQQRIDWWSQERIHNANVMVVGAGAIGNETLKNLALLGFANIFIVDFDTISTSNLSRTVLFRKTDVGQKKAEVAAQRTRDLCLVAEPAVNWFHGDIAWELGTGLYRDMDVVLGCLDNVETRFVVNKQCWLAQTPWIDSGISELGTHVTVFIPPTPPCYECGSTKEQRVARRQRYSCDDFKRSMFQEGKVPTVQITSSIASAIQVQEAVKYICGQSMHSGRKIYYQGKINDFDVNSLPISVDCDTHHLSYTQVTRIPLSAETTLRSFLNFVSQQQYSGERVVLDFKGDRPAFVLSISCRSCGRLIVLNRPTFRIYDIETICQICQEQGARLDQYHAETSAEKVVLDEFSLDRTEDYILDMSLWDIGVPFWHIVAVRNAANAYHYYELIGDRERLLPHIARYAP